MSLHAHEREGSADCLYSNATMGVAYREREYALAALVGHNYRVTPAPEVASNVVGGIEEGEGDGRDSPHIVRLPDLNFSFLAHPAKTFPTDTRQRARAVLNEYRLDGVEKFNAGRKQYGGHIGPGFIELANDDAHSPYGIGSSYMLVNAPSPDRGAIIHAIRQGDYEMINTHPSTADKVTKGVALGRSVLTGRWP